MGKQWHCRRSPPLDALRSRHRRDRWQEAAAEEAGKDKRELAGEEGGHIFKSTKRSPNLSLSTPSTPTPSLKPRPQPLSENPVCPCNQVAIKRNNKRFGGNWGIKRINHLFMALLFIAALALGAKDEKDEAMTHLQDFIKDTKAAEEKEYHEAMTHLQDLIKDKNAANVETYKKNSAIDKSAKAVGLPWEIAAPSPEVIAERERYERQRNALLGRPSEFHQLSPAEQNAISSHIHGKSSITDWAISLGPEYMTDEDLQHLKGFQGLWISIRYAKLKSDYSKLTYKYDDEDLKYYFSAALIILSSVIVLVIRRRRKDEVYQLRKKVKEAEDKLASAKKAEDRESEINELRARLKALEEK